MCYYCVIIVLLLSSYYVLMLYLSDHEGTAIILHLQILHIQKLIVPLQTSKQNLIQT